MVDEAYVDFADPVADYSMLAHWGECDNIVVLRTFSKLYGLAGLRLGFGVMPRSPVSTRVWISQLSRDQSMSGLRLRRTARES